MNWLRISYFSVAISFFAVVSSVAYGVFIHRPLFADCAYFFYNEIATGWFSLPTGYRWLTALLEVPGLLVFKAFYPIDVSSVVVRIDEVMFSIYPFVGVLVAWLLLRSENKSRLMIYPLIGFAAGTMLSIPCSAGESPEVVALFWPMLILIKYKDLSKPVVAFSIMTLILLMSITHETAALALVALSTLLIFDARNDFQSKRRYFKSFLAGLSLTIAVGCVLRRSSYPSKDQFFLNFFAFNDFYARSIIIAAALFTFGLAMATFFPRFRWIQYGLLGASAAVALCGLFFEHSLMQQSWALRVYDVPVAVVLGVCFYFYEQGDRHSALNDLKLRPIQFSVLSVLLLTAAKRDMSVNFDWEKGITNLRNVATSIHGCYLANDKELDSIQDHGVFAWVMPFSSVLIQGNLHPQSIVFSARKIDHFSAVDPCVNLAEKRVIDIRYWLHGDSGHSMVLPNPTRDLNDP